MSRPRGRPRKSAELRAAQGLVSHKAKAKQDAPSAAELAPPNLEEPPARVAPPDGLSAKARKVWAAAAPRLVPQRLLTETDVLPFARYCEWLAEFHALKAKSRKRVVSKAKTSKIERMDRTFQALMMLDKRLLDYEDRFGMNPRERLAIMAKLAGGASTSHAIPPQPPSAPDKATSRPGVTAPAVDRLASPIGVLQSTRH